MLSKETFQRIVEFFSNNFEIIIAVNLSILLGIVILLIVLAFAERHFDVRLFLIKYVLVGIVVIGELFLIAGTTFVYWVNYHYPVKAYYFVKNIRDDTSWVKNDIEVYFVNNNVLNSIRLNGKDKKTIFGAELPIREYHFSPDGKYMLIVTQKALFLLRRADNTYEIIDSVNNINSSEFNGTISSVSWAPDSKKFCYEIAKWSKVSSQDNFYVYDIVSKKKRVVKSPARKISSVLWDKSSENMFYLKYEVKDTTKYPYPFEVKVIKIPYDTLKPYALSKFPADKKSVPIENLDIRGVDLFLNGDKFSFNRSVKKDFMKSKKGIYLGIDNDDYLYVVMNRWFRKRLFQISRRPSDKKTFRYQYKGGDLLASQIRWIPGGRYVIMDYKDIGLIVLEPSNGKVGRLTEYHGDMFGWYSK